MTLKEIHANLVEKPLTLEACVVWSRLKFEEHFSNSISQLLFNFPLEMSTSSGAPFWRASIANKSPPRQCPSAALADGLWAVRHSQGARQAAAPPATASGARAKRRFHFLWPP